VVIGLKFPAYPAAQPRATHDQRVPKDVARKNCQDSDNIVLSFRARLKYRFYDILLTFESVSGSAVSVSNIYLSEAQVS